MDSSSLIWSSLLLLLSLVLWLNRENWRTGNGNKNRPPGPPGWPVVGNIFDLGTMAHRILYELKFKYGPVLRLRIGSVDTVVIQSAKAAMELFKNHDATFCDRTVPSVFTSHNYKEGSLALGRFGPYWRTLRRICAIELLANRRINETAHIRRKCIDVMIRSIEDDMAAGKASGESGKVHIPHYLFLLSFNLIGNLMLSKDLFDSKCKEGYEFFEAMDKVMVWAGTPNLADFLPFLQWLDPQGLRRNMSRDMGRAKDIVAGFLKERIEDYKMGKKKANKDFLDVLLEFDGDGKEWEGKIPYDKMIIIILEMFFAGSETTSSTMEWAMAELFSNPEALRKVKDELDAVVGENRKVEESDIDKLPYLQAVIKETVRLHPVIPLLIPRNTIEDTNFMGYHISKGTQVLVNAWAIGRDPESWEDPMNFKPERFLGSNIDYKGQNFDLIPFGSGRRVCVGMGLAQRVVPLGVASLLHNFEWDLDSQTIDMSERMAITARKLVPLNLACKKRPTKSIVV